MEDLNALVMPDWYNAVTEDTSSFNIPDVDTNSFDLGETLGEIDLKGIASVAGVVGGFMSNRDDKKYKREMLDMEKERIARARDKQDKFESDMKNAWS